MPGSSAQAESDRRDNQVAGALIAGLAGAFLGGLIGSSIGDPERELSVAPSVTPAPAGAARFAVAGRWRVGRR